jgi:hypothetical protein
MTVSVAHVATAEVPHLVETSSDFLSHILTDADVWIIYIYIYICKYILCVCVCVCVCVIGA